MHAEFSHIASLIYEAGDSLNAFILCSATEIRICSTRISQWSSCEQCSTFVRSADLPFRSYGHISQSRRRFCTIRCVSDDPR
jgi:hypothetical protein